MSAEQDLLKDLRKRSTPVFLILSLITLEIYTGHYLMRWARGLNRHLEPRYRISLAYTRAVLAFAYLRPIVIVAFATVYAESEIEFENFGSILNLAFASVFMIWAFMARARINFLLNTHRTDREHFEWFWTMLFAVIYINYKINKTNRQLVREAAANS